MNQIWKVGGLRPHRTWQILKFVRKITLNWEEYTILCWIRTKWNFLVLLRCPLTYLKQNIMSALITKEIVFSMPRSNEECIIYTLQMIWNYEAIHNSHRKDKKRYAPLHFWIEWNLFISTKLIILVSQKLTAATMLLECSSSTKLQNLNSSCYMKCFANYEFSNILNLEWDSDPWSVRHNLGHMDPQPLRLYLGWYMDP